MRGGGSLKAPEHDSLNSCRFQCPVPDFVWGFTLAEVLVTLGIIGVVAALTLPVLISKYQHFVLVNRAKKANSVLNQAYYKTLSDLEFSNTCFYGAAGSRDAEDCRSFREQLFKNLKIIKNCNKGYKDGCIIAYKGRDDIIRDNYKDSDISEEELNEKIDYASRNCGFTTSLLKNEYSAFVLNDGLTVIGDIYTQLHYFSIDTNGAQGPNKWGYDLFTIYVYFSDKKKLQFVGSDGCTLIEKGGMNFDKMLLE